MINIDELALSQKMEIAEYIKNDTLDIVNEKVNTVYIKKTFYTCYMKRFLDIVISFVALVLTLPINLVLAIVTFFDVGYPIIFKQQRIGKDNKKFTIYKFRNMTNETDANGELLPPSQRVTRWGKFVRKTSLDELLNFVSILKGDMSLIGPRPLLDYYADRLNNYHKAIYKIRPGLECPPPQKIGHPLSWQERLDTYVWYVENCSFLLDVKLAFRIVELALDHKSTSKRSNAGHGGLMGYNMQGDIIYSKNVPEKYIDEFLNAHNYSSLADAIHDRYQENHK